MDIQRSEDRASSGGRSGIIPPALHIPILVALAIFAGLLIWSYLDRYGLKHDLEIARLKVGIQQLGDQRAGAFTSAAEEGLADASDYAVEHEVVSVAGATAPDVVSKIYRMEADGTKTLLHSETNPGAEELEAAKIEGRFLILSKHHIDWSPGPCDCYGYMAAGKLVKLDLDDTEAGTSAYEPSPEFLEDMRATIDTCEVEKRKDPLCRP